MFKNGFGLASLRSMPVLVLSAILVIQVILFHTISTAEYIPHPPPLKQFENNVGPWKLTAETEIQTDVQALLKADDTLSRQYSSPNSLVDLFVAFFKTQRAGVTPHSPKVCLPGNGWTPESSGIISVRVPSEAKPIPVNRYTVRHGDEESLVMYWYQGAHRAVASEYMAKLYLMLDSLRYHRSDVALIRVIVPVSENHVAEADRTATEFIRLAYGPLKQQMWR